MSSSKKLIALLMLLALTVTGCARQDNKKEVLLITDENQASISESKDKTSTQKAYIGSIVSPSTMKGDLDYRKQMTVTGYGFENSELAEITVSMGQKVHQGDVLARVKVASNDRKISELENQLDSAQKSYQTGLQQVQESLEQAREDLASSVSGSLQAKINQKAVEKAQAAYDSYVASQNATLQGIRQNLDEMRRQASNTDIVAPMSGVIRTVSSLKEGDKVNGDTLICIIADPSTYCLSFSSTTGAGFRTGSSVDLTINGSEIVKDAGRIVSGPDLLGMASGNYLVDVSSTYSLDDLKKINSIYVNGAGFDLDNVLLIPLSAVKIESDSYYVKVDNNGLLSKRYLQLSAQGIDPETEEEVVMVSAGLEAGETVVVYGG